MDLFRTESPWNPAMVTESSSRQDRSPVESVKWLFWKGGVCMCACVGGWMYLLLSTALIRKTPTFPPLQRNMWNLATYCPFYSCHGNPSEVADNNGKMHRVRFEKLKGGRKKKTYLKSKGLSVDWNFVLSIWALFQGCFYPDKPFWRAMASSCLLKAWVGGASSLYFPT